MEEDRNEEDKVEEMEMDEGQGARDACVEKGSHTVKTGVDAARSRVARIAGHVISQHEDDVRVWHAHPFDGTVDSQRVGNVPVRGGERVKGRGRESTGGY